MSSHGPLFRTVALVLVVLTVLTTTPISAAELKSPPVKGALGSVSTVGSVQLRGITVAQEGTLFAGDVIRSRANGYAKLVLHSGHKLELGRETQVRLDQDASDASVVQLALASGNVAFTSAGAVPLRIAVAPFEISLDEGAAGNVAILGTHSVGVRSSKGAVRVRNTETRDSFLVNAGEERLLGRDNGAAAVPLTQVASTLPTRVPTFPAEPAPRRQGTTMSSGAWIALLAAVAGGAAVGSFFIGRSGRVDEEELFAANEQIAELQGQVSDLNDQIAALEGENAALEARLIDLRNAFNIELNTLLAELTVTQVGTFAEQIEAAVLASGVAEAPQLTARAQFLINEANVEREFISSLRQQIESVRTQIDASPVGADISGLRAELESLRQSLVSEIGDLNAKLAELQQLAEDAEFFGVEGIPEIDLEPVPDPDVASPIEP